MTEANTPASTIPDRPQWAQDVYDRQLARLDRLAEMGMLIGAAIEGEAKAISAGEGAVATPEALRAFEVFPRIARAVRLTLMLEDKVVRHMLGEDKPEPRKTSKDGKDGKDDTPEPIAGIRRVSVHRDPDGTWHREYERAEAGDRPDREHLYRPPPEQPLEEAVEDIRHDLESAAETFDPDEPRGMPGEYPPKGCRYPAGGRGSPGDWGG